MKDFDVDNRDLTMLRMRSSGTSVADTAAALGISPATVMNRCGLIRKDDLASGDDPQEVMDAYW